MSALLPPTSIYIGNPFLCEELRKAASSCAPEEMTVKLDPSFEGDRRDVSFVRDRQVVLLSGTHLIPFSLTDPFLGLKMKILLFFMQSGETSYGVGFAEKNRIKAIETCSRLDLPFKIGKTTLEGGNCLLFTGADGAPRAIIGINSLILSYLALEEQGIFIERKEELIFTETPSEESLFAARNEELGRPLLLIQDEMNLMPKTPESFREIGKLKLSLKEGLKQLSAPLTEEDRETYRESAIIYEAQIEFTKRVIAEELEIPLGNIAFIFQNHFHIDLELFVTPEGDVCFHDERESLKFLEEETFSRRHAHIFEAYSRAAKTRIQDIARKNEPILASIGCSTFAVPGCYSASGEDTLNFMNGILIRSPSKAYFFTNGAPDKYHQLKALFAETMRRYSPLTEVVFVGDNTTHFTTLLKENQGGLHCITWT